MYRSSRAVIFRFHSKTQWQMFLFLYGSHVCAPQKDTNMASPRNKLYKFGWHASANNARMKNTWPDSWRRCSYINHLSYPRFLTLSIEWLRFLVLITWLVKTENKEPVKAVQTASNFLKARYSWYCEHFRELKIQTFEGFSFSKWFLLSIILVKALV